MGSSYCRFKSFANLGELGEGYLEVFGDDLAEAGGLCRDRLIKVQPRSRYGLQPNILVRGHEHLE